MSDAPKSIWIDAWGGNWSPRAGGTQEHEYTRSDLCITRAESDRMVAVAVAAEREACAQWCADEAEG